MWPPGNDARKVTVRVEGIGKGGRQRRGESGEVKDVGKVIGKLCGFTVGRKRKV